MSAPSSSARLATSFMKLMRVASIALQAYLVSSALRTSISTSFSWLRLNGAYSSRITRVAAGLSLPITMRSGRVKSAIAAPSFRNSGLLITENSTATPRLSSSSAMAARTLSAVPTGTVDLSTMTVGALMRWPMLRAAARMWVRSALPSSSGGVPTARKITSAWATASS